MMTCIMPERERDVGAGIDRQIPVGALRGAGAIRIDDDEFGTVATGFFDERPQVHVVAVNVGAPGDDYLEWRNCSGSVPSFFP